MGESMKKGLFYISITVIICILTFTTNIPDLDLWARLAVGSIFSHTGQVLKHDIYSYVPTKDLWIDHEWGSGVVFYLLVNHFGEWGLFALKALILLAIFILFIKIIKLQTNQEAAGIFYFIFLGFSLLPGIANLLRCQMFTYLFFTLWIYLLEKLRCQENKIIIWVFPVSMLFWVNLHGGFLAGIGLVIIYAIGEFLNRQKYLKYFSVLALIIPVTLINPYGLKFWNYIIDASLMTRPGILEWAPISLNGPFHIIKGFNIHVYSGFFIFTLLTILVGIKLYLQKASLDWARIILVVLLLYLSIKRQRHTAFFLLAIPALFYHHYVKLFEPLWKIIENHLTGKIHKAWAVVKYSFGYIFLTVIFVFMMPRISGKIFVDPAVYPVGSLEFIKQNNISGNVATTFGWGSYAFWKLYPQCKVLIDGRYEEVYPDHIYYSAMQFSENKGDVQEIIKKYKTDVLILSKRKYSPADVLNFTDWKPVYEDLSSVLLLPKDKIKDFYMYPDYNNPIYYKDDLSRIIY